MKFEVAKADPETIKNQIVGAIAGRKIADILSFDVTKDSMTVYIQKFGTSTLVFSFKNKGDKVLCELVDQKIAFTHRPFEDEVKTKLKQVVEQLGGVITEA